MLSCREIGVLITLILLFGTEAQNTNVARGKRVVGSGQWQSCAVDGNYHTTFAPGDMQFPYYYVDLGALYNLSSIRLFCQNQWSFYEMGVNEPFDVHTYGEIINPCSFEKAYPWDPLASDQIFKRKGQKIELRPEKLVRYIIIGRQNKQYPKSISPIVIGEIEAYGEKVKDMPDFQLPVDPNPIPKNYYLETRKQITGNLEKIWLAPGIGHLVPDYGLMDVVLAWRDQALMMAAIRGRTRVMVSVGNVLPKEIHTHPLYSQFKVTAGAWLTNGSAVVKYSKVTEAYQSGDILLIGPGDNFDVEKVYANLISGENVAAIGTGMEDPDSNLNQLLRKLNVTFVRNDRPIKDGFVSTREPLTSPLYIPVAYLLDRLINSWNAMTQEDFVDSQWLGWKEADAQAKMNEFVEKYQDVMKYLGPCEMRKYNKRDATYRALLNYNKILRRQYGDKCHVLPHVQHAPGDVRAGAKPTNVVVRINSDQWSNFFSTGVYAKPGEAIRWTVLNSTDWSTNHKFFRINAQLDSIVHHGDWSRWPIVATNFELTKTGQVCSPHGGPIFLQLPAGLNITVRIENGYRYPWLDVRNEESVRAFPSELKQYNNVPWLVVNGDSMNTMLMMNHVLLRHGNETIGSVRHYDNAIKMMHNFRGTRWQDARNEVFVSDVQISAGYGHSGYPMMGYPAWSLEFTQYSRIKNGHEVGYIHEIGHNLQVGEATLKNGGEVTNNVYRTVVRHHLLGLSAFDDRDTGNWKSPQYNGPGWGYYKYMMALFGTGVVGNGFIEARKARPGGEYQKTQFWLKQMCKETGYDLLPFHELWKFPVSDDTKQECGRFPCFFPDDQWTRGAQARVDEILRAYGKNCTRTNPSQVKFRGDIMLGVGTVRPQTVFLEFE